MRGAFAASAPEGGAALALGGPLVWLAVAGIVVIGGLTYYVVTLDDQPREAPSAPGSFPMRDPSRRDPLTAPSAPGAAPVVEPVDAPPLADPVAPGLDSTWFTADTSSRIVEPVPGLYTDLDTSDEAVPIGWDVQDQDTLDALGRLSAIETVIDGPRPGARATFSRRYDPTTGLFTLEQADLAGLPAWIPVEPAMVPGRGVPTALWATLRQMRRFEIELGSLERVQMPSITNLRTIIELHGLKASGVDPDEAIRQTHSYRFAETVLVQSGHRIRAVTVVETDATAEPVDDDVIRESAASTGDPSRTSAELKSLMAQYGLTSGERMSTGFAIVFAVEGRGSIPPADLAESSR